MTTRTPAIALLLATTTSLAAVPALAAGPDNDHRADAQGLDRLPARVNGTTAGATLGKGEPGSPCGSIAGSVYYRLDAKASRRMVARLQANGDLDAIVDVYEHIRSQQTLLSCDVSDGHGRAALSFPAQRDHSYLVRVSRRTGSQQGSFALGLQAVRGPQLPGPPLPETGMSGSVDPIARSAQPWSVNLKAGVRYRVAVIHRGSGCVRASLYRPRTRPSSPGGPAGTIGCDGYGLFTPREGQGGRYGVLVRATGGQPGPRRYHLEVAPALPDDSAPGVFVRNYQHVPGSLGGIDGVDLYRFDVTRRSVLFANAKAKKGRRFDLVLLDQFGDRLRCACGGTGTETLHKGLRPGRFFLAVRGRDGAVGGYRLLRASRTITKARLRVNGSSHPDLAPGATVPFEITTRPAVNGPVTVTLSQFDPLSGWQFARALHAQAVNGRAVIEYAPPTAGRWRARATFDGTQSSAPSEAPGFARFSVQSALHE